MNDNLPAIVRAEMELSRALSLSDVLPRDFRAKPANVLVAVGIGRALGLEPAVALTNIAVIDGKPSLSAQLQAALVRRAGHRLRVEHNHDGSVTATLWRKDDPQFPHTARWTMERAQQAGLLGKGAWKQYPDQMLANRAITEVVRLAASEVMMGAAYTDEELGADPYPETQPDTTDVIEVDPETGEII